MNHLYPLEHIHNRYFAMRHGHSIANQQRIIVSDPQNGVDGYGLSEQGREQVARAIKAESRLGGDCIVISSDFKRARETAAVVAAALGLPSSGILETALRERYFGSLELGADDAYAGVWQADALDADSQPGGVESANQVMQRVSALILELEQAYSDRTILLVSHGDALQILQTAFARRHASEHRQLEHLQTAEIRELELAEPV